MRGRKKERIYYILFTQNTITIIYPIQITIKWKEKKKKQFTKTNRYHHPSPHLSFFLLLSLSGSLTYFRSESPFADEFGALGVDREGGIPLNGLGDRLNKNEGRFDKFAWCAFLFDEVICLILLMIFCLSGWGYEFLWVKICAMWCENSE